MLCCFVSPALCAWVSLGGGVGGVGGGGGGVGCGGLVGGGGGGGGGGMVQYTGMKLTRLFGTSQHRFDVKR